MTGFTDSGDKPTIAGRTVLVTGGSGFIGALLCRRLTELGADVHAISRRPRESEMVRWWSGDLADAALVRKVVAGVKPDIVYHLASEVTGKRDLGCVMPTVTGNLLSSINLLLACAEQGCHRVVMAGSLEEPDQDDSAAAVPCSPYAAAKWASSGYCRMFHALYQTPVTIARLFMVYGPGQSDLRKLIPYVTLSLLRGETPKLSSGSRPVDWIFVQDVVDGLVIMGTATGIDGHTLDIGSGELVTTGEVANILSDIAQAGIRPELGALPDRPMERVKAAAILKTRQMLDWSPSVSLRGGLEQTFAWYREQLQTGAIRPG